MAKTKTSACARSNLEIQSLLEKSLSINTLRKPLKMTATLKRRALKKKAKREAA